MNRLRFTIAFLLVALLVLVPLGTVGATANLGEETTTESFSGVVETIVVETDEVTEITTVLVTLTTENGKSVTVRLSAEAATTLGLVKIETLEEEIVTPDDLKVGEIVQLDPATIILDEGATPLPQDVMIEGTIQSIEVQVDDLTEETTVVVTLLDGEGIATPYRISVETAVAKELVTVEIQTTEILVPDETMIGQTIEIAPEDVLEEIEAPNPVAGVLGTFFGSLFGLDPAVITEYHADGMGYGVIAQAGILSYALGSDETMMQTILDAKLSGDYSTIVLSDGSTATNWGQLRQAVMHQENSIKNLGSIISGHADDVLDETEVVEEEILTEDSTMTNNGHNQQNEPGDHGNGRPEDKPDNGKGHNK